MNFYIDFEATQPEQEIISIGAVAENGKKFYSLIKPRFSKVSSYITEITGIKNIDLEYEHELNTIFDLFYIWCKEQEENLAKWHFYSYGDGDIDFLKHSFCNLTDEKPMIVASYMIATMKDYSKDVTKYFHGTTSLIKAFNYLKELDDKQKHNALEDAKMLAEVYSKISNKTPLEENPFKAAREEQEAHYTFPSGRFFCKGLGKNAKEREFVDIHEAIEWIINTNIRIEDRENVHRDRMATKIMKSIRKHSNYMGYKWRRDKNTKIAFVSRDEELHLNNAIYYGTQIELGKWILPYPDTFIYVQVGVSMEDTKMIALDSNKVNINGTNYELRRK